LDGSGLPVTPAGLWDLSPFYSLAPGPDVLLSARRDLPAARRFFTRALRVGTVPAEVTTDRAPDDPRVLDELVPSALQAVERQRRDV
jgi:transposase-like protein